MDERDDIRYLIRQRINAISTRVRSIKFELSQKQEIKKLVINQVYEHYAFEDTITIKNIYVEEGAGIMVETLFRMKLFEGDGKIIVTEYNKLIEKLKKEYVLIREVK